MTEHLLQNRFVFTLFYCSACGQLEGERQRIRARYTVHSVQCALIYFTVLYCVTRNNYVLAVCQLKTSLVVSIRSVVANFFDFKESAIIVRECFEVNANQNPG